MGTPSPIALPDEPVILFDGVCNLCNRAVKFVLKHDKRKHFKFASLQSTRGQELLQYYGLSATTLDTFIVISNQVVYQRSDAALEVVKKLHGLWPILYSAIILPKFFRDAVYNMVAKSRYRIFGKREQCMIPSPEIRSRFLD